MSLAAHTKGTEAADTEAEGAEIGGTEIEGTEIEGTKGTEAAEDTGAHQHVRV